MLDGAQQLLDEIKGSNTWPLEREAAILQTVRLRRAFRRADAINHRDDRLRLLEFADWEARQRELFVGDVRREYVIDPLPRLVATAFADFLWGAEPEITAATDGDQPWLDLLLEENDLAAKLRRAERLKTSEGEAWFKVWTDPDVAITPLVDWYTRLAVTPLWRGDKLLACAFHTDICDVFVQRDDWPTHLGEYDARIVYRHLEIHGAGHVLNVLFQGSRRQIGREIPLTARPETEEMVDDWKHGLPMLAGRFINDIDEDASLGVGDYDSVADLFLALNEARTIGVENTRLTAKKRLFVAAALTAPDGSFDAGSDVIQVDSQGGVLGDPNGKPPVSEVEYSYDADPLIAHTNEVEGTILSRVGLVPQLVGKGIEGHSQSGTAIRLRFLPTENAAAGKGKTWDRLPDALQLVMLVDHLPVGRGGFGRDYSNILALPTVERGSILPRDDIEIVEENSVAVTAGIRSRRTAVRAQHDNWTDDDVQHELDEIEADEKAAFSMHEPVPVPGAGTPSALGLPRLRSQQ